MIPELLALFAYSMVYAILPGLVVLWMAYSIHVAFEDERLQDAQDEKELGYLATSRRSTQPAHSAQPGRPPILELFPPAIREAKYRQHLQARMGSKTTPPKGEQTI